MITDLQAAVNSLADELKAAHLLLDEQASRMNLQTAADRKAMEIEIKLTQAELDKTTLD